MSPSTAADLRDLIDALSLEISDVLDALTPRDEDARKRVERTRQALQGVDVHGALLELDELARGA